MKRRQKTGKEEVETLEEEVIEERRKCKPFKRQVTESLVSVFGQEAVEHLINAEIEIFKAFRAMIDKKVQNAERAMERLQEIEVS